MDYLSDLLLQLEDSDPIYRTCVIDYVKNLQEQDLPVIFSTKHLAGLFAIEYSDFIKLLSCIDGYYAFFLIKKRRGGKRRIVVPYQNLQRIQRWILHEILEKVPVHPSCKGFIKGGSTLKNAKPHVGKMFIRKFDLKDFFESINVKRVYWIFRDLGYSPAVSHDLATLCTLKLGAFKYNNIERAVRAKFLNLRTTPYAVLAQGAPTSPMISNIICKSLDCRLAGYARRHGIQYSRYADDITFSADNPNQLPRESFIKKIVCEEGLRLNESKTGTYGPSSRREVTGLLIDGTIPRVPQKIKRQIYRHLHFCQKYGVKDHFNHIMPNKGNAREWLYGMINYVNSIEPQEAKKMFELANALDWGI